MSGKDKQHKNHQEQKPEKDIRQESGDTEIVDVFEENNDAENKDDQEIAANAQLQNDLDQALQQIEKDKDDYLRLMAEFDNYRKRVLKEKADLLKNAAERVLLGLLPIVDDFERGLAALPEDAENAERKGMELIYNKLVKYLDANGVKAMDTTGSVFDADYQEAIATIPAPSEDMKGKVLDTTQKGYTINDKVLRHAKVVVGE